MRKLFRKFRLSNLISSRSRQPDSGWSCLTSSSRELKTASQAVVREVAGLCGGVSLTERFFGRHCGQNCEPQKSQPLEQAAEVVADRGEDGVDRVAGGMGEVIAA